jgi:hypothetical protein
MVPMSCPMTAALSIPTQIRHHDGMIAHQIVGEFCPHVAGVAKAVYQNHGRSAAADAYMNFCAIGCNGLGLKAG